MNNFPLYQNNEPYDPMIKDGVATNHFPRLPDSSERFRDFEMNNNLIVDRSLQRIRQEEKTLDLFCLEFLVYLLKMPEDTIRRLVINRQLFLKGVLGRYTQHYNYTEDIVSTTHITYNGEDIIIHCTNRDFSSNYQLVWKEGLLEGV